MDKKLTKCYWGGKLPLVLFTSLYNMLEYNRGENRQAVEEGIESLSDTLLTLEELPEALSNYKDIKSRALEDESLGDEVETLAESIVKSVGALLHGSQDQLQTIMANAYRGSSVDPIDLRELGFSESQVETLSAKMS